MSTCTNNLPAYALIIRATNERGEAQEAALSELARRGLWLTDEQKRQAGMHECAS